LTVSTQHASQRSTSPSTTDAVVRFAHALAGDLRRNRPKPTYRTFLLGGAEGMLAPEADRTGPLLGSVECWTAAWLVSLIPPHGLGVHWGSFADCENGHEGADVFPFQVDHKVDGFGRKLGGADCRVLNEG
jgi:hypothetical protein